MLHGAGSLAVSSWHAIMRLASRRSGGSRPPPPHSECSARPPTVSPGPLRPTQDSPRPQPALRARSRVGRRAARGPNPPSHLRPGRPPEISSLRVRGRHQAIRTQAAATSDSGYAMTRSIEFRKSSKATVNSSLLFRPVHQKKHKRGHTARCRHVQHVVCCMLRRSIVVVHLATK